LHHASTAQREPGGVGEHGLDGSLLVLGATCEVEERAKQAVEGSAGHWRGA
jgi:hypothetical protein